MKIQSGISVTEITPDPGIELCGFAKRKQPSTHIIDPLWAKCLVLSEGNSTIFWITVDLIGIESCLVQKLKKTISVDLDLNNFEVIISASHTHSGPGTVQLNHCGQYRPDYLEKLVNQLSKLCDQSYRNLFPCTLSFGQIPVELSTDRRDQIHGCTDPNLSYLAISDVRGTLKMVLVNYSMHPVCMWTDGISADYPGRLSHRLSEKLPGNPIVMFTLGACGNLNPPKVAVDESQMVQWVQKLCEPLAMDINEKNSRELNLSSLKIQSATLNNWWQELTPFEINAKVESYRNNPNWISEFGLTFNQTIDLWQTQLDNRVEPLEITLLHLSHLKVVTINAEIFAHFIPHLKQLFPNCFLVSCTNGLQGYLPHYEAFAEGGYEVETAPFFFGLPPPQRNIHQQILELLKKF